MNNLIRDGNLTPYTILGTPMPYVKLAVCGIECQFLRLLLQRNDLVIGAIGVYGLV